MPAPGHKPGRAVCPACGTPLRADNRLGYCRTHRFQSPAFMAQAAGYARHWRKTMKATSRAKIRASNKVSSRAWRLRNAEKRKAIVAAWIARNPEKNRELRNRGRIRLRSTVSGLLNHRMSVRVRHCLTEGKRGRGWEVILGYTVDDLIKHLEALFTEGMTWDRFFAGEIHIDHIKPLHTFSPESMGDAAFKESWALANLQPLWADDHRQKSGRESAARYRKHTHEKAA